MNENAEKPVNINLLHGINQRDKFKQSDPSSFDDLNGLISQYRGTLQRINGTRYLTKVPGAVLSIYPTNDSRRNVIVQTTLGILLFTEQELFGHQSEIDLDINVTPTATDLPENMAHALIVHKAASGADGGGYTTAGVWQDAPLTDLVHQVNPDGSAATFVTPSFGTYEFTLSSGVYRIRGWSMHYDDNAPNLNSQATCRLLNVTAGSVAAWAGLPNEVGSACRFNANVQNGENRIIHFGGFLNLAIATKFKLQHIAGHAQAANGFGKANAIGTIEIYREIEILKTN